MAVMATRNVTDFEGCGDKRSLSERDICTKFITPGVSVNAARMTVSPTVRPTANLEFMGIEFLWQVARVHQGEQIRYIFYLIINYLTNNHT